MTRSATTVSIAAAVCLGGAVVGVAAAGLARGDRATTAQRAAPASSNGGNLVPLPGARKVAQPAPCKGYRTYGVPKVAPLQKNKTYRATIATNKGTVVVDLLPKVAPIAVQSFIFLADHRYFDGVSFHRVVPGFVIQGGDPTGTGYCGPGYEFKDEPVHQPYVRGTLAMANAGPNTNGSQFFIVLANNTALNQEPNYTIFGQVRSGMSAVDRIAAVKLGPSPSGEQSLPLEKVYMKSVRITVK